MADVVFIALAVGFIAASIGLVRVFERLREKK